MIATTTPITTPRSTDPVLPLCTWTKGQGGWYVQFPGATTPEPGFVRVRRASGEVEIIYVTIATIPVRGVDKQVGIPVKGIKMCPRCGKKAIREQARKDTGNYLREVTHPWFRCIDPDCGRVFGG